MMLAEFHIVPMGVGESVSSQIAELIKLVESSGLSYRAGPMGTTVEGDWDDVMVLIKQCHAKARTLAGRVLTSIYIDDREGGTGRLEGKVRSVEEKLGKTLRR